VPPDNAIDIGAKRVQEAGPGRRTIRDEAIRAALALTFTLIFLLTLIGAFACILCDCWANAKEFLQLALPAETALLGSAVGYYFGSMSR
jgi:hypothetical protein